MRQSMLERLRDLDGQLSVLNKDVMAWVECFISKHRFEYADVLMNYNLQVMSWIANWASIFSHDLKTQSVFDSETATLDVKNIIEKKRTELKTFLDLRHHYLPWGMRDITCSPYMPAHMACVFAVETVINETESTCSWLMPWVERIIGSALETDIKSSTENEQGKFLTPHYLMAHDRKSLIAVKDYCRYVESTPAIADAFFLNHELQADIKNAFGISAFNYLKAVQYFHVRRTTDDSVFGFHMFNLAVALHESSVNRLGREYRAKEGYEAVLIRFYDFWETLPLTVREQLASTRLDGYTHSLGEYLLTLYVTVPAIPLTDDVKLEVERLGIIKCAAVISSALFEFIYQNRDWYTLSVFVSNNEPPIYTQDDLIQLREVFEDTITGDMSPRMFACSDAFATSIRLYQKKFYQNFFQLAELIPLFSMSELLKITEDPKQFCLNTHEIFLFLSRLPDNQMRLKCWHAFSSVWQFRFQQTSEIILLFSMMDFQDTELLTVTFNEKICHFFASPSEFYKVIHLKKCCEKFNFSMADVCRSFVKSILAFAPLLIVGPTAVLKCLSVFTTESEFQAVLSSTQASLLWSLAKKGEDLLDFLDQLKVLTPLNSLEFDVESAERAVLQYALPYIVSHDRIQEIWAMSMPKGCCAFFGPNKTDSDLYVKLVGVNDNLMKGVCTSSEASDASTKLLHEYMVHHKGGAFLKAVKLGFCANFFERVSAHLPTENHPDIAESINSYA